jgi:DNA-binding NarL/FixJ family response regulator
VTTGTEIQTSETKTNKLSKGEAYDLNVRELQVLHYVSEGLNNREIAEKLFLSEGTIKNYISIIYSKLNVHDRIKASKKALDEGMI